MVDLAPGSMVDVDNPNLEVATSMPGVVADIWLKEGPPGPAGRNITSVVRTSGDGSAGTLDTYTITFSDSTTTTFQVRNGANGVNGTGDVASTRAINTTNGLQGGGNLTADRTLSPVYGSTSGTVAQGNDTRLVDNAKAVGGGLENAVATSATTGTVTCNATVGSWFYVTPTGAITLAFSNLTAGKGQTFFVEVNQGATAYAVTMPTGTVKWIGAQPTQTINKTTCYTIATRDAGTTWLISAQVTT